MKAILKIEEEASTSKMFDQTIVNKGFKYSTNNRKKNGRSNLSATVL